MHYSRITANFTRKDNFILYIFKFPLQKGTISLLNVSSNHLKKKKDDDSAT